MSLFLTPWDRCLHLGAFPLPAVTRVPISGAPAFMHGLRILFVSDVHLRSGVSDAKLHALLSLIAAQRADLLLLGGDYAESERDCIRFFDALRGLSHPLGAFGVPGNNDHHGDLAALMARGNVQLLRNRSISLPLPGGLLQIGGSDEHHRGSPLRGEIFSREGYRILLSHFPAPTPCAADLMLSGHTHGGQVNFLGLTPYSFGFEALFRLHAVRGLHKIGGMQLAVCSGIGVSKFPLRLGAGPEILLVEFGS